MGNCSEISAPSPASELDIPDELLELVFLRLPSSLHLVRAACTCKRWRRIIADGAFLRRLRSLRASPLVAGHYRVDERTHASWMPGCNPVFFLSPTADTVDLRAQHFSLDFLPAGGGSLSWDITDSRGGLLLLNQFPVDKGRFIVRELVVCQPMTRRYRVIALPVCSAGSHYHGAFLLDGDVDENGGSISLSNFRIVVALRLDGIARACVFSSGSESDHGWTMATEEGLVWPQTSIYFAGEVAESIYWSDMLSQITVLDKDTAEFSCCNFFPDDMYYCSSLKVVACDGGKVRLARLHHSHLKVFIQAEARDQWVLEKSVELQQVVRDVNDQDDGELQVSMLKKIVSVAEGSVVLCTDKGVGLVSVDLPTMKFKRLAHDKDEYHGPDYMYQLPWPPTFRACLP